MEALHLVQEHRPLGATAGEGTRPTQILAGSCLGPGTATLSTSPRTKSLAAIKSGMTGHAKQILRVINIKGQLGRDHHLTEGCELLTCTWFLQVCDQGESVPHLIVPVPLNVLDLRFDENDGGSSHSFCSAFPRNAYEGVIIDPSTCWDAGLGAGLAGRVTA